MSKKSKKRAAAKAATKPQKKVIPAQPKKPVNKKLIAIVTSAIVLVGIIVGILVWALTPRPIDYLKDDLSKYIKLSAGDYKGYTLSIPLDEVNDALIEREIMKLRYSKRTMKNNGGGVINLGLPIGVGDTVKIFYRGYTVDAIGNEIEIDGANNLFENYAKSVGIGQLLEAFPIGFEEALIGLIPSAYTAFSERASGEAVEAGDVVYLSYSATLPDGSTKTVTLERVDLSRTDLDAAYGVGFTQKLVGLKVGEAQKEPISLPRDGKDAVYTDLKVVHATTCEGAPLTVSGTFPAYYADASLRGKTAYFDVYFKDVIDYDVPDYNEEFITTKLGITADDLAEYDGDSLLAKHRAKIVAELTERVEKDNQNAKTDAVWEHLTSVVKIKKMPIEEIETLYGEYYMQVRTEYMNGYNQYYYSSLSAFAAAYLGLSEGESWLNYIYERAESVIIEKLIFYYIIRKEGLVPTDAQYKEIYDASVEEYLEYFISSDMYKEELEAITDPAEREARIAEIKLEMLEYYGENYFNEMTYYEFALDDIVGFATFN